MSTVKDSNIQEITFKVADVEVDNRPFKEGSYQAAIQHTLNSTIEGWPIQDQKLVPAQALKLHGFLSILDKAFNYHRPFVISPDMIWLLIAQGFAKHILLNAEKMRTVFVNHEGQKELEVSVIGFIKGQNNHWEKVFPLFTQQIQEKVKGEVLDLLVPEFSTTTPITKAAFELTLMESMSKFFKYTVYSRCGIPSITLQGSSSDWQQLIDRCQKLKAYDLDWWISSLIPILETIKLTSQGKVDTSFWDSIYKFESESGDDTISGWITRFFPYLEHEYKEAYGHDSKIEIFKTEKINDTTTRLTYRNDQLANPLDQVEYSSNQFTTGITITPFKWDDTQGSTGKVFNMEFIAGFMGATQNPETLALKPEISWAVREKV